MTRGLPLDRVGRARLLGWIAIGCVALFTALYVVAERTAWGQRLGNDALAGQVDRPAVHFPVTHAVDTVITLALVLLGLAVVAVAVWRRRVQLALAAGIVLAGANVTTQLLKKVVLTRTELVEPVPFLSKDNIFPSGHSTLAMGLAIALVVMVPERWRGLAALVGGTYATIVGIALLTGGLHRPGDVIGAYLIVTAWTAAVAAVHVHRQSAGRQDAGQLGHALAVPVLGRVGATTLVVVLISIAGPFLVLGRGSFDRFELSRAYGASTAAIVISSVLLLTLLVGALRGVNLDESAAQLNS